MKKPKRNTTTHSPHQPCPRRKDEKCEDKNNRYYLNYGGRGSIHSDNVTPVTLKPLKTKSFGKLNKDITKSNLVIEGDNAPVMKSLCDGVYRIRGKVDLMLWDPPYNTGNNDFIYEDNFYLTKKDQHTWTNNQPKKTVLHVESNKN